MSAQNEIPMDRRTALKWMLTAAAALPLAGRMRGAAGTPPDAKGYGTDPDLTREYKPGELWPLTMDQAQRRTATALCDIIIPADASSPSASAVGVVSFIDEWVSAPYPNHVKDRKKILEGLAWIEAESMRRFSKSFADLPETSQAAICDDICYEPKARPEFANAARFFARYRDLTAGGFYTSPEGTKDLKYVGNVPLATFDGPPPEVLKKVGLA
jgi:hypothetical protein